MFIHVTLLAPPYSTLTYLAPENFPAAFWHAGQRVTVPLGKGENGTLRAGYIKNMSDHAELPDGTECKKICWPLEKRPLITGEMLKIAEDLALRQGTEEGVIYGHILPSGLRSASLRIRYWDDNAPHEISLSDIRSLSAGQYDLLAQKFLQDQAYLLPPRKDAASLESCSLLADPPWKIRPGATRQSAVLDYLYEHGTVSKRRILKELGASAASVLASLIKNGLVAVSHADEDSETGSGILRPPPFPAFRLNDEQRAALDDLKDALRSENAECRLLYGVTGSGKTAVYMELAKLCIAAGKSAFILAPEVALAQKLHRDILNSRPNADIYLYHGYQNLATREKTFRELAARQAPCIITGTRSALFLPAPFPGCIILDEEHDASFKQDENFAYHAKEIAWFRMKAGGGLLLLGSATPDIRTFHAVQTGKLPALRLKNRIGEKSLPPVRLVAIGPDAGRAAAGSLTASAQKRGLLAPACEEALRDCQKRGEQAVILLNRRGYAPLIYCLDCGKTLRCPNCEIGLSFHKNLQKLICHYCGHGLPWPSPCPHCGGMNFLAMGEGTEKLAERLEIIAGRPILRLDRDSARRPGKMEEILEAFGRNESPFLVGTQMLSKGHHFPNVTLVVVADGDMGLNLPDYRAAERTFQLLVQSAGRAGRGEKPGSVLIQTRDASHYCWNYILTYDYEGFYAAELERRKKRNYPPFVCLSMLRISFDCKDAKGQEALNELAGAMKSAARELDLSLLGPAPAPLGMLRGQKRYQCLIKSSQWNSARQLFFFARRHKAARHLRIFLDIDPVNMM